MKRTIIAALLLAGCSAPDMAGVAGGIAGGLLCGPAAVVCGPVLGHAFASAAYTPPVTVTADALAGTEAEWTPTTWPAIGVTRPTKIAATEGVE